MNKIKLALIYIITFTCSVYGESERRAAIDIGSGSIKMAIAEVDTDQNIIINTLFEQSFPVAFQASYPI
jgi:hypothetical protein